MSNNLIKSKSIPSWCYWNNAFNDEELNRMCEYFDTQGVEKSLVFDETNNKENARISNTKFHNWDPEDKNTSWIFEKINNITKVINNNHYQFDLYGYGYIQYTEYDENGKYDFHMDTILNQDIETRKLSVTIFLNEQGKDYEGGDFEFTLDTEKNTTVIPSEKGKLIVFPSFIIHRVKPVTKGKRKSLVVWILGPKFK